MADLMSIYEMCRTFRALPRPGGVLDQPARIMFLLLAVDQIYAEHAAAERRKQEAEARSARKR